VAGVGAIAVTHLTIALLYSHLMMTDFEPELAAKTEAEVGAKAKAEARKAIEKPQTIIAVAVAQAKK